MSWGTRSFRPLFMTGSIRWSRFIMRTRISRSMYWHSGWRLTGRNSTRTGRFRFSRERRTAMSSRKRTLHWRTVIWIWFFRLERETYPLQSTTTRRMRASPSMRRWPIRWTSPGWSESRFVRAVRCRRALTRWRRPGLSFLVRP